MSRVVRETVERVSRRDSRAFPDDASSLGIGEVVLRRFAGRGETSKVVMRSDRITVYGDHDRSMTSCVKPIGLITNAVDASGCCSA